MTPQRFTFFLLLAAATLLPAMANSQQPSGSSRNVSLPSRIRVDRSMSETDSNETYWRKNTEGESARPTMLSTRQKDENQDEDSMESADDESSGLEDPASEPAASALQGLKNWPRRSIRAIEIDPRERNEKVPPDRSGPIVEQFARNWSAFESVHKTYCWQAPNIYYRPLYFEDIALERYGQTPDDYWQTAISAAHFFSSAALLPLHFRYDPISSCDYPLGYCRPGVCTRKIWQRQFWGRCP